MLLQQTDHRAFLDSYGELGYPDAEKDGKFWIYNNILNDFSLKDFVKLYNRFFDQTYIGVKIDKRTVRFQDEFSDLYGNVKNILAERQESQLFVKGLQVLLIKKMVTTQNIE